MNQETVIFQS